MAVPKTSATGGYLTPAAAPAPLEGQALNRFFQQFVVGITGLDGKMVRPAWQSEPADIPDAGDAWASIRTETVESDTFPAIIHDGEGDGSDQLQRHEQIHIVASFYDLGTNGRADDLASLLRDGLAIPQNLEALTNAGMGLNSTGNELSVPVVVKTRWMYRVDFDFIVSRQVDRIYSVQNVLSANGTLVTSDGNVVDIEVAPPPNP